MFQYELEKYTSQLRHKKNVDTVKVISHITHVGSFSFHFQQERGDVKFK